MNRYISSDTMSVFIKSLRTFEFNNKETKLLAGFISDYICNAEDEIVRCKDCTHYIEPYCTRFIMGMISVNENDFCSRAERKKQNENN